MSTIFTSDLHSVQRFLQGKVRDIYAVDDAHLLIVATDRLSAFDVVLPTPIPDKGRILTAMSNFWFARTTALVPNHLTTRRLEDVLTPEEVAQVHDRAVIVRRIAPLPVEAIVRGYIAGSAWAEYQQQGTLVACSSPPACASRNDCRSPCSRRRRKRQRESMTSISRLRTWSLYLAGGGDWPSKYVTPACGYITSRSNTR